MRTSRRNAAALAAGTIGLVTTLATGAAAAPAAPAAPPAPPARPHVTVAAGQFQAWSPADPPKAVVYDSALVPTGAAGTVVAVPVPSGTEVALIVSGLKPDRTYGAHVHTTACGATGAAAGPHYQNVADPVQPSMDPTYANPRNEVWLDFTTDRQGRAVALAHLDWTFRPGGANSVVIHEHATSSADGQAGMAGARVACLTAAF
jgi:Cu-Zn family superoxide dismutase